MARGTACSSRSATLGSVRNRPEPTRRPRRAPAGAPSGMRTSNSPVDRRRGAATLAAMSPLPLLAAVVGLAGCTLYPMMSETDCEAMCARQGDKVETYQVGSVVPIFKPIPPSICTCKP